MIKFLILTLILLGCSTENDFSDFDKKYSEEVLWKFEGPCCCYLDVNSAGRRQSKRFANSSTYNIFSYSRCNRTYYAFEEGYSLLKSGME